jgi:hypothetical protein
MNNFIRIVNPPYGTGEPSQRRAKFPLPGKQFPRFHGLGYPFFRARTPRSQRPCQPTSGVPAGARLAARSMRGWQPNRTAMAAASLITTAAASLSPLAASQAA